MKTLIWIGLFAGGILGGYLPVLFGAAGMSLAALAGNTVGGLLGIWAGYALGKRLEV